MHLVVQVRLLPSEEQEALLQTTLERCNEACSWISEQAVGLGVFHKIAIQKAVYGEIRDRFGLGAQATVRCIAKVAASHTVGKRSKPRTFRRHGAQPYDPRILTWGESHVSIWTLEGRIKIPFKCSERQREMLESRVGEVDLLRTKTGKWLLVVPCEVEEAVKIDAMDFLGIDLGIVNLATDSDGDVYSGHAVELNRRRYAHRRRNLQKKGTKASERKLKQISGREARFRRDINHQISKAIVLKALRADLVGTMKLLRDASFQDLLVTYPRPDRTFVRAYEQPDTVSSTLMLRDASGNEYKPDDYLKVFSKFVQDNEAHIEAIRILLSRPREWKPSALEELRLKLTRSTYRFTLDNLQRAHEIHHKKALVDIISMVKHAADEAKPLFTAAERVEAAFKTITKGHTFTADQQKWLDRIQQHMRENLSIDEEDFDAIPIFSNAGGLGAARKVFGIEKLDALLHQLNEAIAA